MNNYSAVAGLQGIPYADNGLHHEVSEFVF